MKNITWLAPKAGLGWYDHIGVVMRLTDQYVFLPESSQKVKHIKSHEKDTTVAWGYHKDVIIDIIIKTIIIHNIFFIIYNSFDGWKLLSVFSVIEFIFTGPCEGHCKQIPLWLTMLPLGLVLYNGRKNTAFIQIVEYHHDWKTVKKLRIISVAYTNIWDCQIVEEVRGKSSSE